MHPDDEPIFKRGKWGSSRYVYNPRNPVGLALIMISLLIWGVMMLLMETRSGPYAPPEPTPTPTTSPYGEPWPVHPGGAGSGGAPGTADPSGP
ncbi:hypothetical protein OG413_11720 [Streptomyces sp. NBC_01433]|uniref:hypothetical protein n=1 Tax=Streptomyces sp. NBC_01433 TaxID=2903864 RepID=UPI00224D5CC9|nr:hypothetical protein [Streptomyces sp. NBC_01433]MCX4675967.1 hypothetical protein [Streptomyces sp. NBC_01433]